MTPTVLLTRPAAQSARFAAAVRGRLGAEVRVVIAPLLGIVPDQDAAARALDGAGAVIFTSENGVAACAGAPFTAGLPAYCVGARTAAAARDAGFAAHTGPGDAAGLVAQLRRVPPSATVGPLVHLHGAHVTCDIAEALAAAGIAARGATVYDQSARPLSPEACACLHGSAPVLVPVFSARSARLLAPALARARAPLAIAAISPAVAQGLDVQGSTRAQLRVAPRPDAEAVLAVLADLVENGSFLER